MVANHDDVEMFQLAQLGTQHQFRHQSDLEKEENR
jgi:hypothetical protein